VIATIYPNAKVKFAPTATESHVVEDPTCFGLE
jgi:hypothetical protein